MQNFYTLHDHLLRKIPQKQQTTFGNNKEQNNQIHKINLEVLFSLLPVIES